MNAHVFVSWYCGSFHRARDGYPERHWCRVLPVAAMRAWNAGEVEVALAVLDREPLILGGGLAGDERGGR